MGKRQEKELQIQTQTGAGVSEALGGWQWEQEARGAGCLGAAACPSVSLSAPSGPASTALSSDLSRKAGNQAFTIKTS